jgi:hypothetical protein
MASHHPGKHAFGPDPGVENWFSEKIMSNKKIELYPDSIVMDQVNEKGRHRRPSDCSWSLQASAIQEAAQLA